MKLFRQTLLGLMVISGIATAFSACDKVGLPAVNVPLTASGLTFTIPPAAIGSDSATFTYTVNIDSLVAAANSSLSASSITSIKLDTVDITTSNGTSSNPQNDFDNITSASLDFTSDAITPPGTITTIVPSFTVPSNSGNSLTLPVNNTINLKPYLATGSTTDTHFTFTLRASLGTAITTPLSCSATIHFTILASL